MKLIFNNQANINIELNDNPVTGIISTFIKHLQNVELPFYWNDNPYNVTQEISKQELLSSAQELGVDIDVNQLTDQHYLNYLHQTYEKNYNGNPTWLKFHEPIHLLEDFNQSINMPSIVRLDYREKGGPLVKKFDRSWYRYGVTKVSAGDCFLEWCELAKTPSAYMTTNEPDNINRVLELVKPWIYLKPKLNIALSEHDFIKHDTVNREEFINWFGKYQDAWMQKHNLEHWEFEDMYRVIPIGRVTDLDQLTALLKDNQAIRYIKP